MITMLTDLPEGVVGFEATGTVEASDYREVLEPAIEAAVKEHGRVRLLYLLGDGFDGYSGAAMWEDAMVGTRDWTKWERIAVVSDKDWVHVTVDAFAWMVPGRIRTFPVSRRDDAVAWLAEDA